MMVLKLYLPSNMASFWVSRRLSLVCLPPNFTPRGNKCGAWIAKRKGAGEADASLIHPWSLTCFTWNFSACKKGDSVFFGKHHLQVCMVNFLWKKGVVFNFPRGHHAVFFDLWKGNQSLFRKSTLDLIEVDLMYFYYLISTDIYRCLEDQSLLL